MTDLLNLFDELDRNAPDELKSKDDKIIRAPFGWAGGKSRSVANILKYLPYNKIYVEPFGGSGAVLLARKPCDLDVYNDRHGGVVAFYRCMRDKKKYQQLVDWLELTIHSREDFKDAKHTWCSESSDVLRAGKWYYMVNYSFGSLGRNFGRSTSGRGIISGKIRNKIARFPFIHDRLARVQIENQEWFDCIRDYDSKNSVFYIDPPYIDSYKGTFEYEITHDDHRRLLEMIFEIKGFCAVSGYSNPLYENQPWDNRHTWDSFCSMDSCAYTVSNHKSHIKGLKKRQKAAEVLWIKEAK
jgi:DNA adenine methylase